MVTSSWPVMPNRMTLPVALTAVMSVICNILVLVTIRYINAFTRIFYLNKFSSVRFNQTSIREYLDA